MRLVVISHKPCWASPESPSGYATDGGFAFQMRAISELFEATTIVVPCSRARSLDGEIAISGHRLAVVAATPPDGTRMPRRAYFPFWLLRNSRTILREIRRADAVHVPIPGDIGTIGMLLAVLMRKPLFVRHCGNWFVERTMAERFWKWFMERSAGGRNVMLATGGAPEAPSRRNPSIRWIFSTTLTESELAARRPRQAPHSLDQPRLVIVCRQERLKGTGVVLESLPLIRERFPGVTLDVVGDGGALDEYRRQAAQLEVDDRVTFHGKVGHDAVLGLLDHADLFVYPTSASEGFPKVVLEALACGLPVITTRVSVLPQLIGGGGGILIDAPTHAAVARAVLESLADKERYGTMSFRAVDTAREYSLESWRDSIGAVLRPAWGPLRSDA